MANAVSQFIKPEHRSLIDDQLAQEASIMAEFALAERAGLDVTDIKKQYTEAVAKLKQLKGVYYPNG